MTSTPMQRGSDTATAVVEGAADGLADGIEREGLHGSDGSAAHLAQTAAPIAQRGIRSERLRARLENADEKVTLAIDKTRTKARALAESARRARHAPRHITQDLKQAGKAYFAGLGASVGFYAAAGFVGLVALAVLTVALVQGLNILLGVPWGTFVVALAYAAVAGALAAAAKGKARAGQEQAKVHLGDAKRELREIAEPLRHPQAAPPVPTASQLPPSFHPPVPPAPTFPPEVKP